MKLRACLAFLSLAGCGALEPNTFQGEVRFALPGSATLVPPGSTETGETVQVRFGVFWNPKGPVAVPFEELVEQPSVGKAATIPGPLDWAITEEPEAAQLATTPGGLKYGLGRLYAYKDANGNGRWDTGEEMVTADALTALVFAPQDVPAAESPTHVAIPKGFHLLGLPFYCTPLDVPVHDGDCGVPLAARCEDDTACGTGGQCLSKPLSPGLHPFPGGYCAIPETAATTCRPKDGALWVNHRDPTMKFWMEACAADADCSRSTPNYQCDFSRGACMPTFSAIMFRPQDGVKPPTYCLPPPK